MGVDASQLSRMESITSPNQPRVDVMPWYCALRGTRSLYVIKNLER